MASVLLNTDAQRRELEERLKDFTKLERNLYPEIESIAEDLGCDCMVSLRLDSHCYDTFRIGVHKNDVPKGFVDVKFTSATPTGDYKVSLVDTDNEVVESQMVGRSDLIDVIESMVYALSGEAE